MSQSWKIISLYLLLILLIIGATIAGVWLFKSILEYLGFWGTVILGSAIGCLKIVLRIRIVEYL